MEKIAQKVVGAVIFGLMCIGLFVGWLGFLCLDIPEDIEYHG